MIVILMIRVPIQNNQAPSYVIIVKASNKINKTCNIINHE